MLLTINEQINKIPILKKLYRGLLNRLLVFFKKESFYVNFKDLKLAINIKDPIDKIIFYSNKYEEEQYNFLCSFIKENEQDYFIDIGANIGLYSLRLSNQFSKLKILAFEPIPFTFKRLKENIKLNNLKNIKTFNIGISNSTGLKKMIALKRKNYIQSGGFSFNIPKRRISKDEIIQKHQSIIGDRIIKLKNKKLVIKIDVEGYEIGRAHV